MEIPLACLVGMPGVEQGGKDGQDVRRCGQEEGDDVVVPQSSDDCREEVGHAAA